MYCETQRNTTFLQPKLPNSVQYTVQKNKVSYPVLIFSVTKTQVGPTEACMIVV